MYTPALFAALSRRFQCVLTLGVEELSDIEKLPAPTVKDPNPSPKLSTISQVQVVAYASVVILEQDQPAIGEVLGGFTIIRTTPPLKPTDSWELMLTKVPL